MTDLLPWDAPAVLDIDVATGTSGGCKSLSVETAYTLECYASPGS